MYICIYIYVYIHITLNVYIHIIDRHNWHCLKTFADPGASDELQICRPPFETTIADPSLHPQSKTQLPRGAPVQVGTAWGRLLETFKAHPFLIVQ